MITIKLEEKQAKEFLTFLLNQQKWLEEASKKEGIDNLKKVRYDNTIKTIKPVIEELERAFRESFESQKINKNGITIVCKSCGHRAYLNSYTINEKKKVLDFWRCPQFHDPKNYEISEGGVE